MPVRIRLRPGVEFAGALAKVFEIARGAAGAAAQARERIFGAVWKEAGAAAVLAPEKSFGSVRKAPGAAAATFVLAALMAAATVGIARGTTFARLSTEDLAHAAVAVVRGRCVGSIVEMRGGEIWTVTSIEIREAWKGDVPRVVRVRLLGGRAANITSHVDGVPRFRAGEDVVLFLSRSARGDFSVLSWAQGTFRVRRDAASGIAMVRQDMAMGGGGVAGIAIEGGTGSGGHAAPANGVRAMRLDEFRREIEAAIAREAGSGEIPARTMP